MEIKDALRSIHHKILKSSISAEITEEEMMAFVDLEQKLNEGYTICKEKNNEIHCGFG